MTGYTLDDDDDDDDADDDADGRGRRGRASSPVAVAHVMDGPRAPGATFGTREERTALEGIGCTLWSFYDC